MGAEAVLRWPMVGSVIAASPESRTLVCERVEGDAEAVLNRSSVAIFVAATRMPRRRLLLGVMS